VVTLGYHQKKKQALGLEVTVTVGGGASNEERELERKEASVRKGSYAIQDHSKGKGRPLRRGGLDEGKYAA